MIDQALEATHNPIDLEGIKEQLQIKLAEVNQTRRMQILEEWSSPSGNSMLWKLLSQDDLARIFFDQKSYKFNKNAMINCDQSQLDEVIKKLNDKQTDALNVTWLEMLYLPPAETIRDLEKELESEAKVQQSTPKILASTERPGEAGREITQIIQLGKCMVPSC